MNAHWEKIKVRISSPRSVPILLFIIAFLAYGLFFWERGFYWDEAPWTWIYYRLGPDALTKTFSTSRPFWGMIYQITMPLLGPYPWRWQLLMVVMRWLTAVLVWLLLRQVWQKDERPALWTSLLFLVYPGLGQNFISLMYTHFYIVLNCFLLSLYLSVLAVKDSSLTPTPSPLERRGLTLAALALSVINLLTMEYFYFMEFVRFILFWLVVEGEWKQRLRRALILFLPYFGIVAAVTFWRLFFFESQNASYSYVTLDLIRQNPLFGLSTLFQSILRDFWVTVGRAWVFPFEPASVSDLGTRVSLLSAALVLILTPLIGVYLYYYGKPKQPEQARTKEIFLLGFFTWLFAGVSFWLVGIEPQLHFSADRFTMPFMLGSSLIVTAIMGLFSTRSILPYGLLALLIAFSIGKQFETNVAYVRDWDVHHNFFWQMSWRIPALERNTTILTNDLPVTYFSDNSLSGPLNWIYGREGKMDHILYFASVRINRGLPELAPGLRIEQNYLARTFYGNTSQMVVINYSPPGCLRVLDPDIDSENRLLDPLLRQAALLSNRSMIHLENAVVMPKSLFAPDLPRGWCYYFEKAELARQRGDWETVVELGDTALKLKNDSPNDPVERFVFIEGYAHEGEWERAVELSKVSYRVSREFVGPVLCRLWERIETETVESAERSEALSDITDTFSCNP